MQKLLFSLFVIASFYSHSFAQTSTPTNTISEIVKCVYKSDGMNENCFRGKLATQIELQDIVGNWLLLDAVGGSTFSTNPSGIVPIDETSQSTSSTLFTDGCTELMAFGTKNNAGRSRTCAPKPEDDLLVTQVTSLGNYTYRIINPGELELSKVDNSSEVKKPATCSLVWLSSVYYLICTGYEGIDQEIKNVSALKSLKKSS